MLSFHIQFCLLFVLSVLVPAQSGVEGPFWVSCVENIAKKDVVAAGGSLQLRAGQKLGSEVAIHAMYSLFQANFTDAAHQIGALNTETWHDSFITCGKEIKLAKGTTQQDPSGMGLYALHVQPLICKRHHA